MHTVTQSAGVYCMSADPCGCKVADVEAAAAWQPDPEMDLVLSDVHIGRAPSATQRCTTVFRFRPGWAPPGCDAGGGASLPGSSPDGVGSRSHSGCYSGDGAQLAAAMPPSSGAVPAQLDEDGDVVVKRWRRSAGGVAAEAAEGGRGSGMTGGIVMHHAMATSLHNVGKQVRLLIHGRIKQSCNALVASSNVAAGMLAFQ